VENDDKSLLDESAFISSATPGLYTPVKKAVKVSPVQNDEKKDES
jgi:hypothetical protein